MTEKEFPIITLWQPWASWIAEGWKTIETRTHQRFASLAGRRIFIHAGERWDSLAFQTSWEYMDDRQRKMTARFKKIRGVIVCSAWVDSHIRCEPEDAKRALIECYTERYGLILSSIEKVEPPVKSRGARGIWYASIPMKVTH